MGKNTGCSQSVHSPQGNSAPQNICSHTQYNVPVPTGMAHIVLWGTAVNSHPNRMGSSSRRAPPPWPFWWEKTQLTENKGVKRDAAELYRIDHSEVHWFLQSMLLSQHLFEPEWEGNGSLSTLGHLLTIQREGRCQHKTHSSLPGKRDPVQRMGWKLGDP